MSRLESRDYSQEIPKNQVFFTELNQPVEPYIIGQLKIAAQKALTGEGSATYLSLPRMQHILRIGLYHQTMEQLPLDFYTHILHDGKLTRSDYGELSDSKWHRNLTVVPGNHVLKDVFTLANPDRTHDDTKITYRDQSVVEVTEEKNGNLVFSASFTQINRQHHIFEFSFGGTGLGKSQIYDKKGRVVRP